MEEIDALDELSRKWFLGQARHNVSAAAANSFWNLAFEYVPLVLQNRDKKIPKFVQQRKKLNSNHCPTINMEYYYKDKSNGNIVKYSGTVAPVKAYERNPNFEKLFETAFVQVRRI